MWVSSNQTVWQQPTIHINMYNKNCMYPFVNCMYCKFPRINDSWFLIPDSYIPDSKVHGANMGPTWVLSAPDGPHVGPMNLDIRDDNFDGWETLMQSYQYNVHSRSKKGGSLCLNGSEFDQNRGLDHVAEIKLFTHDHMNHNDKDCVITASVQRQLGLGR